MSTEIISPAEFATRAVPSLRKGQYKGIHSVYSGFNEAFRAYFNGDPVAEMNKLAEQKVVEIRPCRGGVMIYLPGEGPQNGAIRDAKVTLAQMGL